jgi:succinyl-CoA synthetase beta subunit
MERILQAARPTGWVLEPEAKRLLALAGLPVPAFRWVRKLDEALDEAHAMGYPLVAKVVSPRVVHKSDVGGVAVGIGSDGELTAVFERLRTIGGFEGLLIEPMAAGRELIIGAKIDYQFGPVVLLGIGGTGVEIYGDTALRMAPIDERGVRAMISGLRARALIEGHRGEDPLDIAALTRVLVTFSQLVMDLEAYIESIDLNPVICSPQGCVIADARIMLREMQSQT